MMSANSADATSFKILICTFNSSSAILNTSSISLLNMMLALGHRLCWGICY